MPSDASSPRISVDWPGGAAGGSAPSDLETGWSDRSEAGLLLNRRPMGYRVLEIGTTVAYSRAEAGVRSNDMMSMSRWALLMWFQSIVIEDREVDGHSERQCLVMLDN